MLVEFSLKLLYSPMCGKNFLIHGVHIPIKCIVLRHFYSCLSKTGVRFPQSSCHHALGRTKLLISPGSILSKISFPQQQKRVKETMICFIKNQAENMKMTWNIRFLIFCMIFKFFKCDSFRVL